MRLCVAPWSPTSCPTRALSAVPAAATRLTSSSRSRTLSPLRASRRASPAPPFWVDGGTLDQGQSRLGQSARFDTQGGAIQPPPTAPPGIGDGHARRGRSVPTGRPRRGADVPLTNVLLLEDRNAPSASSAISRVPLVPRPERIRHRAPLGLRPPVPHDSRPGAVLRGDANPEPVAAQAAAELRRVAETETSRLATADLPRPAAIRTDDGRKVSRLHRRTDRATRFPSASRSRVFEVRDRPASRCRPARSSGSRCGRAARWNRSAGWGGPPRGRRAL